MRHFNSFKVFLTFLVSLLLNVNVYAQTPVQAYGQLSVSGTNIVNSAGAPVQLRGMSMFWSNTGWGGENYYTAEVVAELKNKWCVDVVRAAMGVEAQGGYNQYKNDNLNRVRTIIDAAIAQGIYVIVDFHSHEAHNNKTQATEFFTTIASEYGSYPNIIYEVFNEPLSVSWSNTIKPYAEDIIDVIRTYDQNNVIVVGTPNWDQDVEQAAANPITGESNIAYALHYYAGSHGQSYRDKAQQALNGGICLFVTEYGVVNADGNGGVNESESNNWWSFLDANNVSYCAWSVNDKNEGASILKSGTSNAGGWTDNDYTTSGLFVKAKLNSTCPDYSTSGEPQVIQIPALVEAEDFHAMSGVQTETTTDVGGGLNVGYIETGDYIEYNLNARESGSYDVDYRIASNGTTGAFALYVDGSLAHSVNIPNTGGWQSWTTLSESVNLSKGEHTVRIVATGDGWNINYIDFSISNFVDCMGVTNGEAYEDNCGTCVGGTSTEEACIKDCEDVWGGDAYLDNCGTCVGGTTGKVEGAACAGVCPSGHGATGAYDNFTLEDAPGKANGAGFYAWGEETLGGDDNPNFRATLNRDAANNKLEATITQGQGKYVPMGFSFGVDEFDNPHTIDLSNDATFSIELDNNSNVDLKIVLALEDINGNTVNTYASASGEPFTDAWKHEIAKTVDAGLTMLFTGDFANGYYANYTSKQYESNFDYSQVMNFFVTVLNQENTGVPNYTPLAFSNAMISYKEIKLGDCSTASNDNDLVLNTSGFSFSKQSFYIYPNPSNGMVTINGADENMTWEVFDAQGKLVLTGVGENIDLTNYDTGMYVVKAAGRSIRIVKN